MSSHPSASSDDPASDRTAARNRRRRRLRATAVPTVRPIENASRGGTA